MKTKKILLIFLVIAVSFFSGFAEDEYNFAVVYTDGIMGKFEPYENVAKEKVGGLARIIGTLNDIKSRSGGNMITLSLGDDVIGANALSSDTAHIDLIKRIKYDVGTIGIHDFDRGEKALKQVYKDVEFPITASNLKIGRRSHLYGIVKQFKVIKKNGVRIGVFGLADPAIEDESFPGKDIKVMKDMSARAQEMVDILRTKGRAQIVIALAPIGYENAKNVAVNTKGIDIICSGGNDSFLVPITDEVHGKDGNPVVVTQAGAGGEYVGLVRLKITRGKITASKWDPIHMTSDAKEDGEIPALVEKYKSSLKNNIVLANTLQVVDMRRPVIRRQEAPAISFVLDAARKKLGVDMAFINTGSIRGDRLLSNKKITQADAEFMFPFSDTFFVMETSGKVIRQMLERSLSMLPEPKGWFLQISGIKFEADIRKAPQETAFDMDGNPIGIKSDGSRIVKTEVLSEKGKSSRLDENKIYKIAVGTLLADSADGYIMLKNIPKKDTEMRVKDIFVDELIAKKRVSLSQDGRIKIRY